MPFTVKDVLHMQVAPALGCTEPVAAALGAAAAASLLPSRDVESVELWVDGNVYKNGLAVSIPGTEGLCGLDTAAALGALGGDPALKLEVLETITPEIVARAKALLAAGKVRVNLLRDRRGLYIKSVARVADCEASSLIEGQHDHITALSRNGEPVESPLIAGARGDNKGDLAGLEAWLKTLPLARLTEMAYELDAEDLDFLMEGVTRNMRLAEYGLKYGSGLGVGKTLDRLVRQGLMKKDMVLAARILASAAADARMDGVKLPAMSSAGSGNHGLTAILPIRAIMDYVDCKEEDMLRAIGLSHIVTAYVKAHTGRLSAICGCSAAAGAGAAAGTAFLLGGDVKHIAGAIVNLIEDLAGIICDGAKHGCALKLATAAGTAVQAALFALQGVIVRSTDGIIASTAEKTMSNVGALSSEGMIETDRAILGIMLEKRFSEYA